MSRPTRAVVDLSAIKDNIRGIRSRVGPQVRIIPAVKANAYGHGAVPVSRACIDAGADMLGVACIDEAVELRDAGIAAPILILGCSEPSAAADIVGCAVESTVCDLASARALSDAAARLGRPARVHVKIDTGMGRIGVHAAEAADLYSDIAALPGIHVAGVFTHLATSDEEDSTFAKHQLSEFRAAVARMRERGLDGVTVHASNSAGILAFPDSYFGGVRPGIMIYGCYPSNEVSRSIAISEALTLKTRIVFIKQATAGTSISYGRTHILKRRSRVATLPVGYADGYSRRLSNCGEAAVRGARVPVIGRVCMDQCLVDVTDVPGVEVGDEVLLYGGGYEYLNVSRIAENIGTISYEVFCNLGRRVQREYING